MNVKVPAMRAPRYGMVTPNALTGADHYTIVGGGKTGIDACLWLLAQGVDPDDITWIMPRDAWLIDRATIQPNGDTTVLAARAEAIMAATSTADLFERLEACGAVMRARARFRADRITLQSLTVCQQVASAALAAHVEFAYADNDVKNELCLPVPHPNSALDWLRTTRATLATRMRWQDEPDLLAWTSASRLMIQLDTVDVPDEVVRKALRAQVDKLDDLLSECR